mmetsp:Transcript_52496/g.152597  ORF Transcript_52496/g.152597 Transcript_52496/m.152597 type:complete len:100 (+) Transcript_52496:213-512(+)
MQPAINLSPDVMQWMLMRVRASNLRTPANQIVDSACDNWAAQQGAQEMRNESRQAQDKAEMYAGVEMSIMLTEENESKARKGNPRCNETENGANGQASG